MDNNFGAFEPLSPEQELNAEELFNSTECLDRFLHTFMEADSSTDLPAERSENPMQGIADHYEPVSPEPFVQHGAANNPDPMIGQAAFEIIPNNTGSEWDQYFPAVQQRPAAEEQESIFHYTPEALLDAASTADERRGWPVSEPHIPRDLFAAAVPMVASNGGAIVTPMMQDTLQQHFHNSAPMVSQVMPAAGASQLTFKQPGPSWQQTEWQWDAVYQSNSGALTPPMMAVQNQQFHNSTPVMPQLMPAAEPSQLDLPDSAQQPPTGDHEGSRKHKLNGQEAFEQAGPSGQQKEWQWDVVYELINFDPDIQYGDKNKFVDEFGFLICPICHERPATHRLMKHMVSHHLGYYSSGLKMKNNEKSRIPTSLADPVFIAVGKLLEIMKRTGAVLKTDSDVDLMHSMFMETYEGAMIKFKNLYQEQVHLKPPYWDEMFEN